MRAHRLILRALGALVLPGVIAIFFAESQACNPACTGPERDYSLGTRSFAAGVPTYETSPANGPYIPFEGAADYHIHHSLGLVPTYVQIYLSFNQYPEGDGNGGYAPSAGNQAIVLLQDEDVVRIQNDTCADYWLRVVVVANPCIDQPDGADTEGYDCALPPDAPSEVAAPDDAGADADADPDADAG